MPRSIRLPRNYTRDPETGRLSDGEKNFRCPVCEVDFFYDVPCEHVLSTYCYASDEGGWCWDHLEINNELDEAGIREVFGDTSVVGALRVVIGRLLDNVPEPEGDSQPLPDPILRRLRSKRLRALVSASLREFEFDGSAADDYLVSIMKRSPTYIGWMTVET